MSEREILCVRVRERARKVGSERGRKLERDLVAVNRSLRLVKSYRSNKLKLNPRQMQRKKNALGLALDFQTN